MVIRMGNARFFCLELFRMMNNCQKTLFAVHYGCRIAVFQTSLKISERPTKLAQNYKVSESKMLFSSKFLPAALLDLLGSKLTNKFQQMYIFCSFKLYKSISQRAHVLHFFLETSIVPPSKRLQM